MSLNGAMGLGFLFTARDLASDVFGRIEAKFKSLDQSAASGAARIRDSFKKVAVGLATFTAGALISAGAFAMTGPAGDFEEAIAAVGAVAGATGDDLMLLHDAALQAGLDTQFAPTEAALGLQELAAAGFNAKEATTLLIPTLDLAAGSLGKLTVEGAAGLASQAMKAFGIDTADAGRAVDQMLQAVNTFALSADDLPLALGTAARGAGVAKQSFEDTLVAIGLVKNIVPGVEKASTAVSVAMENMVDPKTQQRLRGIGVSVDDGAGGFRSLLDVLSDIQPALAKMTDQKQAAFLLETFGREAMGGVGAILTQVGTGIKGANGEILKGGAALAYLRDQMQNADGAAAGFRDKMLATFNGQKKLLSGSLQTLGVVLGEPFIEVFKPIVSAVIDGVNQMIAWFKAMPASTKTFIARLVVITGALLMVGGALVALPAAFTLVSFAVKAMAVSVWSAFAPMIPLILGVSAALGIFYVAFRKDGEGVGDFASRMFGNVRLAFQGLSQIFSSGAFSGEVMREIDRAENSGIKDFVTWVYSTAYRIEQFWRGMSTGFSAAYEVYIRPALDGLRNSFGGLQGSLSNLGGTIGRVFGGATTAIDPATIASEKFTGAGENMGVTIGKIVAGVTVLVDWFTKLLDVLTQVIEAMVTVFDKVGTFLGEGAAQVYLGITEPVETAKRSYNQARDMAAGVQVQTIEQRNEMAVQRQRAAEIDARHEDVRRLARPTDRYTPSPLAMPMPAVAQIEVQTMQVEAAKAGLEDPALMMELVRKIDALANRPTIVQVDGEAIARASAAGAASAADRSFTPAVATY
jgi:TP901 family phage tail tape measure protein